MKKNNITHQWVQHLLKRFKSFCSHNMCVYRVYLLCIFIIQGRWMLKSDWLMNVLRCAIIFREKHGEHSSRQLLTTLHVHITYINTHIHVQLGPYIFAHRHNFYYFSCGPKHLSYSYIMSIKVHTLIFNLRVFSSKLEERLRNYSCLIFNSPLFQGTISNWTIDSKAVSWTGVGYSFIISTSIKQVKVLELILSVPFAFGSCCSEPTSCGQNEVSM